MDWPEAFNNVGCALVQGGTVLGVVWVLKKRHRKFYRGDVG